MGTVVFLIAAVFALYTIYSFLKSTGSQRLDHTSPSPGASISIDISRSGNSSKSKSRGKPLLPAQAWKPAGSPVKVAGREIAGGMIYVGSNLSPVGEWRDEEPALVDPSRKADWKNPDHAGEQMGYWPSYGQISPESRAAYLQWLDGGRSDSSAYIGYVFLFFYGLERRLLEDLSAVPGGQSEASELITEVERLLSIYGHNRSFRGYANALIQIARAIWSDEPAHTRKPSFYRDSSELTAEVRLALGQVVAAGEPIPAEWALAWVIADPNTRLRTPAKRCPNEFRDLFLRLYTEKFGAGMKIKPNKRQLKLSYKPASSSFGGIVQIPFEELPDVGALSRPLGPLRAIAESAESQLEGYSRFIGGSPDQADSLEAFALLPSELTENRQSPEADRLRSWVESNFNGEQQAIVSGHDLIANWNCAKTDRIAKRELVALGKMLSSFDCAFEPDPRFGGGAIAVGKKAVLFRPGPEDLVSASAGYRAAALLLHMATVVAAGDGEISGPEKRHLEEHLERSMHLNDSEARRLRAHLRWLIVEPPSLTGVKRRLEEVDARRRQALAEFVVTIAGADGVIDPGEVKTITKIYKLLGFDPDRAYGDIHSLQTSPNWQPASAPVTVRPSGDSDGDFGIPARPGGQEGHKSSEVKLDMTGVERILAETAEISGILGGIFADDEHDSTDSDSSDGGVPSSTGLDPAHSRLLKLLTERQELSREQFEQLCEGLDLLADGAFETLNEAAFEHINCPVLAGDDPIEVDLEVAGELIQ